MKWRSTWTILRTNLSFSKLRWRLGREKRLSCSDNTIQPRTSYRWSARVKIEKSRIWIEKSQTSALNWRLRCKRRANLSANWTKSETVTTRRCAQSITLSTTSSLPRTVSSRSRRTQSTSPPSIVVRRQPRRKRWTRISNLLINNKIPSLWTMRTRRWTLRLPRVSSAYQTRAWILRIRRRINNRSKSHRTSNSKCSRQPQPPRSV